MTIFKKTYTERFTVQPNTTITDSRLSFGARGLLAYLLSKPKDWEVRTKDLVNASPAGISAVRSMVKELEEHGYLVKTRTRNSAGIFIGQVTEVYDEPQQDYPQSGFPHVDNPKVDNRTLLNKDQKQSTKRKTKAPTAVIPDSLNQSDFLETWDEWKEFRKKNRYPFSVTTQQKQLNQFEKWGVVEAITAMNTSMINGWRGVFKPKYQNVTKPAAPKAPQYVPDASGRF